MLGTSDHNQPSRLFTVDEDSRTLHPSWPDRCAARGPAIDGFRRRLSVGLIFSFLRTKLFIDSATSALGRRWGSDGASSSGGTDPVRQHLQTAYGIRFTFFDEDLGSIQISTTSREPLRPGSTSLRLWPPYAFDGRTGTRHEWAYALLSLTSGWLRRGWEVRRDAVESTTSPTTKCRLQTVEVGLSGPPSRFGASSTSRFVPFYATLLLHPLTSSFSPMGCIAADTALGLHAQAKLADASSPESAFLLSFERSEQLLSALILRQVSAWRACSSGTGKLVSIDIAQRSSPRAGADVSLRAQWFMTYQPSCFDGVRRPASRVRREPSVPQRSHRTWPRLQTKHPGQSRVAEFSFEGGQALGSARTMMARSTVRL